MEKNRIILSGTPVSEGMACAKAFLYQPQEILVREEHSDDAKEQQECCNRAFDKAKEELEALYSRLAGEDEEKAKIFVAHQELLDDEEILDEISMAISEDGKTAEYAVYSVFSDFAALLSRVEDPLIAGRAADLLDVRNRVIRLLQGRKETSLAELNEEIILVAGDLLPSDTATLNRKFVKGIVTELGGTNSHSAILARSFQIPAVLNVADAMVRIVSGEELYLDALSGTLLQGPSEEERTEFLRRQKEFLRKRSEEEQFLNRPAVMKDGTKVQIGLNIGAPEFEASEESYDFIGLFRSEFLYMENTALPSEEQQFQAYKTAVERAGGKPVTLRTLDIGGDKTLPYMELPKEENPFLGQRALRLCLERTDIFLTQLRAALRASAYGPLQLMFPMVGSVEDIRAAKLLVKEAMESLDAENTPYDKEIKQGIMVEVPSIALIADLAAEEADFASIGSNDLTQYVCAADRMNRKVECCYQSCSPAMLRLLEYVFRAFAEREKPVSICGEMAGNPEMAVLLTGLGARKLSMSAASVAGVKAALSKMTLEGAKKIAAVCCNSKTEKDVIEKLRMALADAENQ